MLTENPTCTTFSIFNFPLNVFVTSPYEFSVNLLVVSKHQSTSISSYRTASRKAKPRVMMNWLCLPASARIDLVAGYLR